MHEIVEKYYKMIEFFQETQAPEKKQKMIQEIQKISPVINEMNYLKNLNFTNLSEDSIEQKLA